MAITELTIENFKGIGKKQTIPIRPITMLFGGNSAGKSTIIQAIHLIKHILITGSPEVDKLIPGVPHLDIGGFQQYVHNRSLNKDVRLGVTIQVDDDGLPYYMPRRANSTSENNVAAFELPISDIILSTYSIEISISWDAVKNCSYVRKLKVYMDNEFFCELDMASTDLHPNLTTFKPFHSCLYDVLGVNSECDEAHDNLLWSYANDFTIAEPEASNIEGDSTPLNSRILPLHLTLYDQDIIPIKVASMLKNKDGEFNEESYFGEFADWIFTRCIAGGVDKVRQELIGSRYIGSLRSIPERGYFGQKTVTDDRWASGLAAWDILTHKNRKIKQSDWLDLKRINKLGLRCQLKEFSESTIKSNELETYIEMRSNISNSLKENPELATEDILGKDNIFKLDDLLKEKILSITAKSEVSRHICLVTGKDEITVDPCDVGVGVSQVIPVAIGVQEPNYSILMVEQPELHIHPRVQCEFADLMAYQLNKTDTKVQLLETHSEHMILRLLRRIRETYEGELPQDAPKVRPESISVIYVNKIEGEVKIQQLRISEDGDFADEWPQGFFEERFDEYE